MTIFANPRQFKISDWFLNKQKDYTDEKYSQEPPWPEALLGSYCQGSAHRLPAAAVERLLV
ncbi:hypothetical protein NC653_005658 [Populus alba x Populus x berolinensis]|uniref:Uncharacterized protein n=1 Tax=Populus alba x Populus x berolinensis TaxID=444605 RepID=A0AAD6RCD7_9ROSI|nr:hypothetical protein NC653_005658 [Populus alba x Populus x berolinensis]